MHTVHISDSTWRRLGHYVVCGDQEYVDVVINRVLNDLEEYTGRRTR